MKEMKKTLITREVATADIQNEDKVVLNLKNVKIETTTLKIEMHLYDKASARKDPSTPWLQCSIRTSTTITKEVLKPIQPTETTSKYFLVMTSI